MVILHGIPIQHHQVGRLTNFNRAELPFQSQGSGALDRGDAQRVWAAENLLSIPVKNEVKQFHLKMDRCLGSAANGGVAAAALTLFSPGLIHALEVLSTHRYQAGKELERAAEIK